MVSQETERLEAENWRLMLESEQLMQQAQQLQERASVVTLPVMRCQGNGIS